MKQPLLQRIFLLILVLSAVALGWTTHVVLNLEHEEEKSSLLISRDYQIRLALEKINSRISHFLQTETARPVFSQAEGAAKITPKPSFVRSYFLLNPEGKLQTLNPFSPTSWFNQEISSPEEKSSLGKFSHPVVNETPFLPHWQGKDLVFIKQVPSNKGLYTCAIWIDWNHLKSLLINEIKDILPNASLLPSPAWPEENNSASYSLTSLPVILLLGDIPLDLPKGLSSLQQALLIVWTLFLLGAGGLVALLAATSRLSNRRAAFVSAVTHELRTPLTNFSLYTEMLEEDFLPEEKKTDYLHLLRAESTRLIHLVENILAYSKIEKHKTGLHTQEYNVGYLFDEIIPRLRNFIESRGFAFKYEMAPDTAKRTLKTNKMSLEQILDNLSDNAVKYNEKESPSVEIRLYCKENKLYMEFGDNGSGISDEARKQLFSPFFRSAEAAAGHKPGVGLGLALARDTARMMGGDLRLKSSSPLGTVFLLTQLLK